MSKPAIGIVGTAYLPWTWLDVRERTRPLAILPLQCSIANAVNEEVQPVATMMGAEKRNVSGEGPRKEPSMSYAFLAAPLR